MQNSEPISPHDFLHKYVLGFTNALIYINGFLLLTIFCSYVLLYENLSNWVLIPASLVNVIGALLALIFIVLFFPFAYFIPATIYMLRWFGCDLEVKKDIRYVFFVTIISVGLFYWLFKAPLHISV